MRDRIADGEEGDPMRLVLSTFLTVVLGWSFLAVNASGRIHFRAGPRVARGVFEADRWTSPEDFYGALALSGVLFLIGLAAAASAAWDLVAAYRRDSGSV